KLAFSYLAVIVLSFSFIAFYLDKDLKEQALNVVKSSLLNQAYLIERQVSLENLKEENHSYLDFQIKSLSSKIKSRITVIDNKGKVIVDSEKPLKEARRMENHSQRPEVKEALRGGLGETIRRSPTFKMDMLYLALPLKDRDDTKGVLRVAVSLDSVNKISFAIRKTVFLSLFFSLALAFIIGSFLTSKIIRPVEKIIRSSRNFSSGDFSRKININSKDELGELADTLNNMADGLKDKISQIQVQNQQQAAILESMVEGIIVTDNESRIISVNSAFEMIFKVEKSQAQGKIFLEVIRNHELAGIITDVLENKRFLSRELNLSLPKQGIFKINASPILEQGGITGCLLVIHDITQLRQLETVRRDFVANVSHELKTPLTSIKGFVETLLSGALEDKENSRHFLEIIQEHAERLDRLISDLLDLSCLESKEQVIEKEKINFKYLVYEVSVSLKTALEKKNIVFDNGLPADMFLNVDRNKIAQVLTNLFDNAIKFNRDNGTVKIYSQDLGDKIKILVEDSGLGIPAKDIPRIFERFYRVDKARSRELGGTGLGLSIVKHIVELHQGLVGVESTEGLGSKFWFTLPK
ncbi:MAG: HAMP domain-containing protein, partial [Candidatus Omnitrophica bacterium]|nr:HAMP domain-containing protein [Candidatus Omnitrophota bacterium]